MEKKRVLVIEINPFNDYDGCGTSAALFDWKKDRKVLDEGPFEFRIETGKTEVSSDQCSTNSQCDQTAGQCMERRIEEHVMLYEKINKILIKLPDLYSTEVLSENRCSANYTEI